MTTMMVLFWCCNCLCVEVFVGLKSHDDKRSKMGSRRGVKFEVGWLRLVWWGELDKVWFVEGGL